MTFGSESHVSLFKERLHPERGNSALGLNFSRAARPLVLPSLGGQAPFCSRRKKQLQFMHRCEMEVVKNLTDICWIYLSSIKSLLNNSLPISGSFVPIRRAVYMPQTSHRHHFSHPLKWAYGVKTWWKLTGVTAVILLHICIFTRSLYQSKEKEIISDSRK